MLDANGDRTINDLLDERADAYPDRTFLVFEAADGEVTETTYAEFRDRVVRCCAGLQELGLRPQEFVLVDLVNRPEFLISFFAITRAGARMVPSNVANTAGELEHLARVSEPRLAITEAAFAQNVTKGLAQAGSQAPLILVDPEPGDGGPAFADLLSTAAAPQEVEVTSDDIALLIFTSGTTRKPKAVMLTHAICVRTGLDTVAFLWLDEGERCLTSLPMFHVNAMSLSLFGALTVGGTLILLQEFRATKYWSQVRRHRATQTSIVAMQLRTISAQPPTEDDAHHDLRRVFYSLNVTDAEKEAFEERFAVTLVNGYGLSEAMTLLCCAPVLGPRKWPSIGLPSPGRRLLLLGEDGNEVAPGEVGEIVAIGTPGRDLMLGYYKDAESTEDALRPGGRLHTGDNAWADEDGYLYYFDRKKDMIKRAGENVSAIEVEGVVGDHPQIAEVAIVGVPDDIRDEAVAAVVVLHEAGSLTEDELIEYCRERLSKFKVPTIVTFVDALPRTSVGKVRKEQLRRELVS